MVLSEYDYPAQITRLPVSTTKLRMIHFILGSDQDPTKVHLSVLNNFLYRTRGSDEIAFSNDVVKICLKEAQITQIPFFLVHSLSTRKYSEINIDHAVRNSFQGHIFTHVNEVRTILQKFVCPWREEDYLWLPVRGLGWGGGGVLDPCLGIYIGVPLGV